MSETEQPTLAQQLRKLREQVTAQGNEIARQADEIRCLQKKRKKKEAYFQRLLETKLNAKRMHIRGVGITDLTTHDSHIEIKCWTRYHQVPGQLAAYQQGCHRPKSLVYFFGSPPSFIRLNQIINLMTAHGIQMFSIDDDDTVTEHNSGGTRKSWQQDCEREPNRYMASKSCHVIYRIPNPSS